MLYSQCKLFRDNGDGSISWTTAWIPQKFPLEPKLTIKIDGIPWIIYEIYSTEEGKKLHEENKARKRHRKESDI